MFKINAEYFQDLVGTKVANDGASLGDLFDSRDFVHVGDFHFLLRDLEIFVETEPTNDSFTEIIILSIADQI